MDEQRRLYQTELINLLRSWGQHSLADRLAELSTCGDPDREKRIADAWVVLHFDVREVEGRADGGIQQFLDDMDALGSNWAGPHADESYQRYRDLSASHSWKDQTRQQAFISRLLDALCPPVEVT